MSMLYLLRHAAAEEPSSGQSDAARALTLEGARKFRRAAGGIVKLLREEPPGLILSSPHLRARQTAEILREAFDHEKIRTELRLSEMLLSLEALYKLLKEIKGEATVLVGHEPILSQWIGQLCFRSQGNIEMKKGALAAVELTSARGGQLRYLLQPGILREL